MKLVAFSGFARVGKSTAARLLGGRTLNFADALKYDLKSLIRNRYGLDPNDLTPREKELVRDLYVAHGKIGRAVNPGIWVEPVMCEVDLLRAEMASERREKQTICIGDMRYCNEAHAVHGRGGTIIYIYRPGYQPANSEEEQSIAELLEAARRGEFGNNFVIVRNDGTLEELAALVKSALEVEE